MFIGERVGVDGLLIKFPKRGREESVLYREGGGFELPSRKRERVVSWWREMSERVVLVGGGFG